MDMHDTVQVNGKRQIWVLMTLTHAKKDPEFSSVGTSFCEALKSHLHVAQLKTLSVCLQSLP